MTRHLENSLSLLPREVMDLPGIADLPVVPVLGQMDKALEENGCALLAAPPGAGKPTLVPLGLMNRPWLENKKIIMLEPRRLAARACATHMAALLGETAGQRIGYQVRMERCIGPKTRVEIVTEGILTRRLQSDPGLEGVGLVIFDEFHERHIHGDLALALSLDAACALPSCPPHGHPGCCGGKKSACFPGRSGPWGSNHGPWPGNCWLPASIPGWPIWFSGPKRWVMAF